MHVAVLKIIETTIERVIIPQTPTTYKWIKVPEEY